MKRLTGLFLLGLATLLPAGLLLYGFARLLLNAEGLLGRWLALWLPDGLYVPEMGLIAAVLLVLLAGLLARSWIGPPVGRWLLARVGSIPVVGRLYITVRDITRRISSDQPAGFTRVVFVSGPNGGGRLGLIADRKPSRYGASGRALVAVYFPAAFQPGGTVEFLPEDCLEPTTMGVDHALGLIFSGGLAFGPEGESDAVVTPCVGQQELEKH